TANMESLQCRQIAVAWESNSGNLLAVAAVAGSTEVISKEYTSSWSEATQFTCASGNGPTQRIFWMSLKANPLSTADDMLLGVVQENCNHNSCCCTWRVEAFITLSDPAYSEWMEQAWYSCRVSRGGALSNCDRGCH